MLLQIEIDTLGKSYSTSLVYSCSEPTAAPEELKALMKLSEATRSLGALGCKKGRESPTNLVPTYEGDSNVCDVS
jgi:hypothetical protein